MGRAETEAQLKEYEEQLSSLRQALEIDPANDEFRNLANTIEQGVRLLRSQLAAAPAEAGEEELQLEEGGKCQAYYAAIRRWVNAEIVEETAPGKCVVKWIGYADDDEVDIATLRPYKRADLSKVGEKSKVRAIFGEDSKWYDAVVAKVLENGMFSVTFEGYGNTETVDSDSIEPREDKNAPGFVEKGAAFSAKNAKDIKGLTFEEQIAALQALPTDSEDVKAMKKRKLYRVRQQQKAAEAEEERVKAQSNWLSYKTKVGKSSKMSKGIRKSSIFKSPDTLSGKVGVTGSGQGMTTYTGMLQVRRTEGEIVPPVRSW